MALMFVCLYVYVCVEAECQAPEPKWDYRHTALLSDMITP